LARTLLLLLVVENNQPHPATPLSLELDGSNENIETIAGKPVIYYLFC